MRFSYDKEIGVYQRLKEKGIAARPKFRGCDEWSREKYAKIVGKGAKLMSLDDELEPSIFVVMLDYIQNSRPLSESIPVPLDIAKLALLHLAELHEIGIVHGDISHGNILLIESQEVPLEVVWIDFASSWTDASFEQITWECDRAAEYFSQWVSTSRDCLVNFQTGADKAELLLQVRLSLDCLRN
jgi:serine/threonine protein kinase